MKNGEVPGGTEVFPGDQEMNEQLRLLSELARRKKTQDPEFDPLVTQEGGQGLRNQLDALAGRLIDGAPDAETQTRRSIEIVLFWIRAGYDTVHYLTDALAELGADLASLPKDAPLGVHAAYKEAMGELEQRIRSLSPEQAPERLLGAKIAAAHKLAEAGRVLDAVGVLSLTKFDPTFAQVIAERKAEIDRLIAQFKKGGAIYRMPNTATDRLFDSVASIADLGPDSLLLLRTMGVHLLIEYLFSLGINSPEKIDQTTVESTKRRLAGTMTAKELADLFDAKTITEWEKKPGYYQAIIELLIERRFKPIQQA